MFWTTTFSESYKGNQNYEYILIIRVPFKLDLKGFAESISKLLTIILKSPQLYIHCI